MGKIIKCESVVLGNAEGQIISTDMPISFWGGVDPESGLIIDPRHDLFNQSVSGKVIVFPYAKGSSGTSAIFLELAHNQKAPSALVNLESEALLISGPILCKYLCGLEIPIANVDKVSFTLLKSGEHAVVNTYRGKIYLD